MFPTNSSKILMNSMLDVFRVTLADQSTYDAKVVGFDQDKDVAVLSIDAPKDKLRPIPIGVSADLLVGQKVFAIGNPVSARKPIYFTSNNAFLLMDFFLVSYQVCISWIDED